MLIKSTHWQNCYRKRSNCKEYVQNLKDFKEIIVDFVTLSIYNIKGEDGFHFLVGIL